MGGAFSCCKEEEEKKGSVYTLASQNDNSNSNSVNPINASTPNASSYTNGSNGNGNVSGNDANDNDNDDGEEMIMHAAVSEHLGEHSFDEITKETVFEIHELEQKFTSKQLYEKKFVWLQLASHSIHMSEYPSKDRRHKEASLSDVTDILRGLPKKYKEGLIPQKDFCLTVVFKRGGGIDLKFDNKDTCNIWYNALQTIVKQIDRA